MRLALIAVKPYVRLHWYDQRLVLKINTVKDYPMYDFGRFQHKAEVLYVQSSPGCIAELEWIVDTTWNRSLS